MTSKELTDLVLEVTGRERAQVRTIEPRPGRTCPWPDDTDILAGPFQGIGISGVFHQQARALELASEKRDFVVATRTSSGKSLCYVLPILRSVLSEPAARSLLLYPTKALARDQAAKLQAVAPTGVRIGVFDGDTPRGERAMIRNHAQIVISNPDMLHLSILPNHSNWRSLLQSLRFVVLDELHVYRGVFGSHVAGVMRRLFRLSEWNRSKPVIIATSATIANPARLLEDLTGRTPVVVDEDSSPQGSRTIVLLEAPEDDAYSPAYETARLLATLAARQVRTLAFCRSRVGTEVVLRLARDLLTRLGADPTVIDSYRAGYTPEERRKIESRLLNGSLVGLASTNALELGIDIGGLDVVLMNGFPGTVTSFWQQAGRAGRAGRDGLAVLVTRQDPLEQSLVEDPDLLLGASIEAATVRPGNPYVLAGQIKCMAHERPVSSEELDQFHPGARRAAESLTEAQELVARPAGYFYPKDRSPAEQVNIRGAGGRSVLLRSAGAVVGEMEEWRAMREAHTGAVYLHRGQRFVIEEFDLARGQAELRPEEPPYSTRSLVNSVVVPTTTIHESGLMKLMGLAVTTVVTGFVRVSLEDGSVLGEEELDLPPDTCETVGVRLSVQGLGIQDAGAVHALEHAFLSVAPLFAGCDRADIESAWYSMTYETGEAAVYVFDRTPGGVGLSERLMETAHEWTEAATKLLKGCPCLEGCPKCLYLSGCPDSNRNLDKTGALVWLDAKRTIISL
ncbi:MAG: DEAD/DEAH box helicase [Fimbriimonadaceae bacterium]|nr:DEAD/DEAH box helicase [Fimbriimonadaceae bacterium]QYK58639.1 MAG: DEAD/DEAH box helicase [Fimbriimonadaceae bacterium]